MPNFRKHSWWLSLSTGDLQIGANHFELTVAADAADSEVETNYRSWFCFAVTGDVAERTPVRFTIANCNKQNGLYNHDYRPVYRVLGKEYPEWVRLPQSAAYKVDGKHGRISWTLAWPKRGACVAFAHFYPFSYHDNCELLSQMESAWGNFALANQNSSPSAKTSRPPASPTNPLLQDEKGPAHASSAPSAPEHSDVLFARELLCHSPGMRRVELLTITSSAGAQQMPREEPMQPPFLPQYGRQASEATTAAETLESRPPLAQLEGGFLSPPTFAPQATGTPACRNSPDQVWSRPPHFQHRPVVVISARVHPGETPASHVMNGILETLTREHDPRSRLLRQMFVFKLIPILNPDGVAQGYYRSDRRGVNLNRLYGSPDAHLEPSIAAARAIVDTAAAQNRLFFYLDLHAHATKRGCFFYGNHLPRAADQLHNVLFARAAALHSPHIDVGGSNFSEKNMHAVDKRDGMKKDGSGRVGVYRATGVVHAYTLECNYNMSRVEHALPSAHGDGGRSSPPRGGSSSPSQPAGIRGARAAAAASGGGSQRGAGGLTAYTPAVWEDVGKACLWGILEMLGCHPWSRWSGSQFRSLAGARAAVWRGLSSQGSYGAAVRKSKVPPPQPDSHRPLPPKVPSTPRQHSTGRGGVQRPPVRAASPPPSAAAAASGKPVAGTKSAGTQQKHKFEAAPARTRAPVGTLARHVGRAGAGKSMAVAAVSKLPPPRALLTLPVTRVAPGIHRRQGAPSASRLPTRRPPLAAAGQATMRGFTGGPEQDD